MTITSTNSAPQQYSNLSDYANLLTTVPSMEPQLVKIPEEVHNPLMDKVNLIARTALIGATLAFAGTLAVPMLGNMAKSVAGKLLPQAGEVTSHVVKSDMVQGDIEKVVKATVSKAAGKTAGKATKKVMDKKPSQKRESALETHKKPEEKPKEKPEFSSDKKPSQKRESASETHKKPEEKPKEKPEFSSDKKPHFQNSSQSAAGETATPLKGKSDEGFQFKPNQSDNTKFSQHKNKSGEYDFGFKGDTAENRKQYLKLSRELHPDKNPNDPEATKAFQALNNAYEKSKEKI